MVNEFYKVKQLKDESRYKEALLIINELEKKHNYKAEEKFEIYLQKLSLLWELGHLKEFIKYIDLADKDRSQIKDKLKIVDFLLFKSRVLLLREENDEAFNILTKAERVLNDLSLREFKERYAFILLGKARVYYKKGDFKRSIEIAYNVLKIAREIKSNALRLQAVKLYCFNYSYRGDHIRVFELGYWFLELARKLNNKHEIISALNILGQTLTEKEEFNQALAYLKQALSLCDEISSFKTAAVLTSLFKIYLEINNPSKAEQCLNRIKQIKSQEDIRWFDDAFRLNKAELLKKKPQHITQIKAREIFKQIVDEEGTFPEFNYVALINLCDSYLKEVSNTNDLKLLDDLQPYLIQLMDIAISHQSFWLLVEGYSFQAKLKLITFEFSESQKLLEQALFTAEKYGQDRMSKLIIKEQGDLSRNLIKWEKLKDSGAKISERMDLARIDEQIELLLQKRRYIRSTKISHGYQ